MAGWKKTLLGLSILGLFGIGFLGSKPGDFWEDGCDLPEVFDLADVSPQAARALWGSGVINPTDPVTIVGGEVEFFTAGKTPSYRDGDGNAVLWSAEVAQAQCDKFSRVRWIACSATADDTGRYGYRVILGNLPGMADASRTYFGMLILGQADGSQLRLATDTYDTWKRAECGLAELMQRQATALRKQTEQGNS